MIDPTEEYRRARTAELNTDAQEREATEAKHGQCWNTQELQENFEVLGFAAPFVIVKRKSDGKKGTCEFQHRPRYYFNWQED